ncbi:MAG: S41 family peptidase [Bacteroidetes bacterium]|nr:S41 family peptidase [Bacteroidota bacterium]MDA1335695.1 S41 family peptidase [Bacteroidota bacterium]
MQKLIATGLTCFIAMTISPWISSQELGADFETQGQKFNTLLYYMDQLYVEETDMESLVEEAIVSMLEAMDPHSVYIPADELQEADEPLNGNFEGVGIQFNIFRDTIMVVSPISGGPSEKLGIMAGDRIVTVDGEIVAGVGVTNKDVQRLLKGPKGTKVTVGIKRSKVRQLLEFEIIRDKIPIFSVDAAFMVTPEIGYIKVNRFSRSTMSEMYEAFAQLQREGMQDLVLDLQGNGGGMLRTAIQMADEFLSEDKLIVYTEGRSFPRDNTYARIPGRFEEGRLVVLIDQGSASASEIVSGAIQDWDRGLIIGRRSFGKGLVQRPVELPDGSAVRLTVQKYYTPAGRCIQKSYDEGVEAYRAEKFERYETGELLSLDSLQLPDSLQYKTRIQNRTVYGGGGIVPDVFVPLDTTDNSPYFTSILRKGLDSRFALTFVDDSRAKLEKRFPTEDSFLDEFIVSEKMLTDFQAFASEEGVEFNADDWAASGEAIALRLKAMIGRNLHEQSTFYRVISDLNESLLKAIEVLEDGTFDRSNLAHDTF